MTPQIRKSTPEDQAIGFKVWPQYSHVRANLSRVTNPSHKFPRHFFNETNHKNRMRESLQRISMDFTVDLDLSNMENDARPKFQTSLKSSFLDIFGGSFDVSGALTCTQGHCDADPSGNLGESRAE